MKTLTVAITLWISSSVSNAAVQDELMVLRLENLKTTMNARDYDLALYRVRQIDVLERACRRETAKEKIPFSCFELREVQSFANLTAKRRIFKLSSLEILNSQCIAAIYNSARDVFGDPRESLRESRLTRECKALYSKRVEIERYKKTGKRIE